MNTSATASTPSDDDLLKLAQRRVKQKMGFFTHLAVYVVVNLGLFLLNQAAGGHAWHHFPLLGWGIGLAFHGLGTLMSLSGDGWRQRLLDQELRQLRARHR